ncbi:MAG: cyclic-di-AMP receptor [Oscillospiraceae bacterium]
MKLILAVTSKSDAPGLAREMSKAGYPSTITNSYGGFLQMENAILVSSVDDTRVQEAIRLIGENTSAGNEDVPDNIVSGSIKLPAHVKIGRAIVMVLDVEQFVRL